MRAHSSIFYLTMSTQERSSVGDIVIGSGPAGVSAAIALIAQGRDVTLLDVGEQMEPDLPNKMKALRKSVQNHRFH